MAQGDRVQGQVRQPPHPEQRLHAARQPPLLRHVRVSQEERALVSGRARPPDLKGPVRRRAEAAPHSCSIQEPEQGVRVHQDALLRQLRVGRDCPGQVQIPCGRLGREVHLLRVHEGEEHQLQGGVRRGEGLDPATFKYHRPGGPGQIRHTQKTPSGD